MTTALLCDHAQVRDGLLFVLSGGITRIIRDSFPAAMGTCLALMLEFTSTETERPHQLEILVLGEDGEEVPRASTPRCRSMARHAPSSPRTSNSRSPSISAAALARAGAYELHIALDDEHRRTLQFWAEEIAADGTLV